MNKSQLDQKLVNANFSRAAKSYDFSCALQNKVQQQLLEKLANSAHKKYSQTVGRDASPTICSTSSLECSTSKKPAKRVLDLGCATGSAFNKLSNLYPEAQIIGADQSWPMLLQAQKCAPRNKKRSAPFSYLNKTNLIAADTFNLPFAQSSFDIIFSSLMLQWCSPLEQALVQIKNILAPKATFAFSTLTSSTLWQLRKAWSRADEKTHVNHFLSPKQIQTAVQQSGFTKAQLTTKTITMHYKEINGLLSDLKGIGAVHSGQLRPRGLTGTHSFVTMKKMYEQFRENDYLPATYKVVYGILQKD